MLIGKSATQDAIRHTHNATLGNAFSVAQVGAPANRSHPPAAQTSLLSDPAAARVSQLLNISKSDKASMSFEIVDSPKLDVTGGVLLQDEQVFAIVNRPRVSEQAKAFGLDPSRLGIAIAEQEVVQKIIQSHPKFSKLNSAQEEAVGEAAYLNSYPEAAIRTLERSAINLSGGGGENYSMITKLTAKAMGEALLSATKNAVARPMSGEQAIAAFDKFITTNASSFSNSAAPYKDAFEAFAKDSLGVVDPSAFRGVFDRTMQRQFNSAAAEILK